MNALNNPEVGKFLNENCVSSFQKVATFKIVGAAKQGGNVAAYFCAPDGRVLHCVAGPVDAATMLREAKWVVETAQKGVGLAKGDSDDERLHAVAYFSPMSTTSPLAGKERLAPARRNIKSHSSRFKVT